eukprot:snap_masked-scaffold1064_size65302-processed-gene-0.5 protein:Tk06797 transcript:snap_masked-scaffold1064_size65302-processed-gene-0.5-mRNA-1 annotation:"hypothetical protein DAPPUDRAFT_311096"
MATKSFLGQRIRNLRITNEWVREFLAEFLGTFVLVLFGTAVVAQVVLSNEEKGDFFAINWGWGVAVTLGVLVSGGVSGGHINPAVTLGFAVIGNFPWKKVPLYMAAQYLGGFVASATVFGVYYEALNAFEEFNGYSRATPQTAGIWATYPSEFLSHPSGIFDQVVSTALLMLLICAIIDKKNMNVAKGMYPLYIGFVVLNIGICFGHNCGYAINPARDLAPRIFTAIAGWGTEPFTHANYWWVVPIVGSHIGAVLGALIYCFFVENHWKETSFELEMIKMVEKVEEVRQDAEAGEKMLDTKEDDEYIFTQHETFSAKFYVERSPKPRFSMV